MYPKVINRVYFTMSSHRILARDLVIQLSIIKILRENRKYATDTFLIMKVVIFKKGTNLKTKSQLS